MGKLVRWISLALIAAWALSGCVWFSSRAQSTPIASQPDTPTVTSVATRTTVPPPTVTVTPVPVGPDDAVLLTWQREGGIAGFCDGLTVWSSGRVLVTSCRSETVQEGQLSETEVAQVSAWAQRFKPFDHVQDDGAIADGMVIRLSFLGYGAQDISEADLRAMLDFAALLISPPATPVDSAVETGVHYVLANEDVAVYGGPGSGSPQIGQVLGGQVARVTGASPDGAWWRVICPDDTVGNCWLSADPRLTQPVEQPVLPFPTATALPSRGYKGAYTSVSPERLWVAQGAALPTGTDTTYRAQLTVWRTDGSARWTVVDSEVNWGLGWTIPKPFHWSRDGRFLYITDHGVPDGCPGFGNGYGLRRVDLTDGSAAEVLPPAGGWMALSPDETRLAYTSGSALAVVIRDLIASEESTIVLKAGGEDPSASLGHILWSPDGSSLAMTVARDRCGPLEMLKHSIVHLDLSSGVETILIDGDSRRLVTEAWPRSAVVILADGQGHHWRMDAITGKVVDAPELDLALPISCRSNVTGSSLYVNPADGYCLRYPAYFRLGDIFPRIANLYGPPLDLSLDPVRASVAIVVEGPVGEHTLSQAVDDWFGKRNLPPPETRHVSALGDELAEVVTYQGERSRGRAVFALHEGMLYVLSFHPFDDRFVQAAPDVKAAWEAVTGSFAFTTPTFEQAYAGLCPADRSGESPYYHLDDGYCLLYPTHFCVGDVQPGRALLYGPPLDRSIDPLMAGASIFIEGPAGNRTLDQVVDEEVNRYPGQSITRAATTLDGEEAVVVEGLGGRTMSRQIFAIHEGLVIRVTVQPVGEGYPQAGPDVERLWQSVFDSFTYLPLPEDRP